MFGKVNAHTVASQVYSSLPIKHIEEYTMQEDKKRLRGRDARGQPGTKCVCLPGKLQRWPGLRPAAAPPGLALVVPVSAAWPCLHAASSLLFPVSAAQLCVQLLPAFRHSKIQQVVVRLLVSPLTA